MAKTLQKGGVVRVLMRLIKRMHWGARIGFLMIFVTMCMAVFAPALAPYGESEITGEVWEGASANHWLGTDHLGRDLYSRLLYGARNTIAIAMITTMLSFFVGTICGLFAAVTGKWVDLVIGRIVDIIMAFPALIFVLIVLSIVGTSIPALISVIALIDSTRVYRLSRAVAMDIEVMEFVESARLRGERIWWIISQEILPNAMPSLIAEFGMRFCFIFLFIASLSFLGLGVQPPAADWGSMVRENSGAITFGIFIPLWPAGAIAFLTVGINLVVDWFLNMASGLRG